MVFLILIIFGIMLGKLKSFLKSENPLYDLEELLLKFKSIAQKGGKLVLCPENTDANWLGIKNATLGMYPDQSICIPQYFSQQVVSDDDLKMLFTSFKEEGGSSVILSGFPKYFEKIIFFGNELGLKVSLIYHGGLSELTGNKDRQVKLGEINDYFKKGQLDKLGIVKTGIESAFTGYNKSVYPVYPISKEVNREDEIKTPFKEDEIHIGVFGNDSFNKNRHTQVCAGLLVNNSVVHVIGENEFSYLNLDDRIVVHEQMEQEEFKHLLGKMNVNLYCSYSESWGQVFVESLLSNVPCVVGMNSSLVDVFFEEMPELFVSQNDNPVTIAKQLDKILAKSNDLYLDKVKTIQKAIDINNQLFITNC
jgi:hypothetical protein